MSEHHREQVIYELLIGSNLLYRNASSYTLLHENTQKQCSESDVMRWKTHFLRLNRVKARFFDRSGRLTTRRFPSHLRKPSLDVIQPSNCGENVSLMQNEKEGEEDYHEQQVQQQQHDTQITAELATTLPTPNESSYLYYSLQEEIRRRIFPMDRAMRLALRKREGPYQQRISGRRIRKDDLTRFDREISIERMNASPEYLAPFHSSVLKWGAKENSMTMHASPMELEHTHYNNMDSLDFDDGTIDNVQDYGNCLVALSCPCPSCYSSDNNQSTRYLMHPTGEMHSLLSLSRLEFPHDDKGNDQSQNDSDSNYKSEAKHELEIGDRILQIVECSPQAKNNLGRTYFVIRTLNYITMVKLTSLKRNCLFCLESVKRIDLRSLVRFQPSYRPCHVAAHPNYGNLISDPLIAIVTKLQRESNTNVIHMGIDLSTPHCISNLQSIELLEFSVLHPMILQASATSYIRPALAQHLSHKRPMFGNGSSIYTIDLRTEKGIFQWSPSAEEFVTEGIHSISGLLVDYSSPHRVFVNSTSSSKMWEIDARMPYKAVCTWSLPGCCNSIGLNPRSARLLRGVGSLLHQPRGQYQDGVVKPILSIDKKSMDAFGLSIYQQPLVPPILGTPSLEVTHGLRMEGASIARSSILPLPDNSTNISYCGIASFRDKATRFLTSDQCSQLGYVKDPSMALSVYTMTSKGDLYSSILLECSDLEFSRSVPAPTVPGAKVLLLPSMASSSQYSIGKQSTYNKNPNTGGYSLKPTLGDGTILSSSRVTNVCVEKRSDCGPFQTIPQVEIYKRFVADSERSVNNLSTSKKRSRLSSDVTSSDSIQFQEAMDSFPNLWRDDSLDTAPESVNTNSHALSTMGSKFWRM